MMTPAYSKLQNIVKHSINESFDFGEIETTDLSQFDDVASAAVAKLNMDMDITALFASLFNIECPLKNFTPIKVIPGILGYCRENNWNICNYTGVNRHNECYENDAFMFSHWQPSREDIHYWGFKLIQNMKHHKWGFISSSSLKSFASDDDSKYAADVQTLPNSVINTINTVISFVTGEPFNIVQNAFKDNGRVFYSIALSPDMGVMVIDHISCYDTQLKNRPYTTQYRVYSKPEKFLGPCIIFTGKVGYKMGKEQNELQADHEQFKFQQKITDFILGIENSCNMSVFSHILKDMASYYCRPLEIQKPQFDKNGHIWYSACSPVSLYGRCQNQWSEREMPPARANVSTLSITNKIPAWLEPKSVMANVFTSGWEPAVLNPKIIGWKNRKFPGMMLYVTPDPMFAGKLLGPDSIEYVKECCHVCIKKNVKTFYTAYAFVWYGHQVMEMFEDFMENTPKKTKIKDFFREAYNKMWK